MTFKEWQLEARTKPVSPSKLAEVYIDQDAAILKIASMGVEKRVVEGRIELRASKKGSGPGTMVGYAAKFNKLSQNLGGFIEKLAPGCFDDVMGDDVRCLRNHMDDNLLGRTFSGTLELTLNSVGLKYEVDLPDTQTGRDTAEMVRRGDMSGSSFQFQLAPEPEGASWDFNQVIPVRTVTRVARLYDVAPVTNPAYEDTEVDMRSFQAAVEARNAIEAEKLRLEAEQLRLEKVRLSIYLAKARLRLAAASNF